jgi:hypothetical protein
MAIIVPVSVTRAASVKYTLVTNMVLFASVYIIADRRIAPKRDYFAFFYGFFAAAFSYILVITTAKENAIVLVAVLFTPVALGFKNLEKHIELTEQKEQAEAEKAAAEPSAETSGEEAEADE